MAEVQEGPGNEPMRRDPVDEVYSVKVTGANIMLGQWSDGYTELQIYTPAAATPQGIAWDVEDGLLPLAAAEIGGDD
jgi:hypothetical protein